MRQRDVHAARIDHADIGKVHARQWTMLVNRAAIFVKDAGAVGVTGQRAACVEPLAWLDQTRPVRLNGNRPSCRATCAAVAACVRQVEVEPEELHALTMSQDGDRGSIVRSES